MTVVICPGYHPPQMTIDFLRAIGRIPGRFPGEAAFQDLVYPADRLPPYSGPHLLRFIQDSLRRAPDQGGGQGAAQLSEEQNQKQNSLLFIGFSAGVVAAIGAARTWQAKRRSVKAVIAIDGWGVPLWRDFWGGNFPVHRMSHDAFTHWSSALLGGGEDEFYADPAVGHLDLWRSPQQIWGYRVRSSGQTRSSTGKPSDRYERITAAALLNQWLSDYGEG